MTEPHLTGKNDMECKECLAPNVMMTSLFFSVADVFFQEEMVQRHETEQRNHGSRVPWVLAEKLGDDWWLLNKSPQERGWDYIVCVVGGYPKRYPKSMDRWSSGLSGSPGGDHSGFFPRHRRTCNLQVQQQQQLKGVSKIWRLFFESKVYIYTIYIIYVNFRAWIGGTCKYRNSNLEGNRYFKFVTTNNEVFIVDWNHGINLSTHVSMLLPIKNYFQTYPNQYNTRCPKVISWEGFRGNLWRGGHGTETEESTI